MSALGDFMIKRVAFLFDEKKEYNLEIIKKAVSVFADCGIQIFLSLRMKNYTENENVVFFNDINGAISNSDIAIVFGGDGSIIYFSKLCAKFNKPILGINTGKMGFLSSVEKDELDKLKCLSEGNYLVENHFLIEAKCNKKTFFALNEISIVRNSLSRMMNFEIYKSGEKIMSFRADGVIVATPTGSTAYSFSSGGPIIDNDANCVVIMPICPHEISCRPIVLSCNQEISIKIQGEGVLSADGVGNFAELNSEMINIKKADFMAGFIRFSKNHMYKNIEKKILKRG